MRFKQKTERGVKSERIMMGIIAKEKFLGMNSTSLSLAHSLVDFAFKVFRKLLFLTTKLQVRLDRLNLEAAPAQGSSDQLLLDYYEETRKLCAYFEKKPLISIILPVYKVSPRYLAECLASVAAQTYTNWELSIVDDGSKVPEIASLLQNFAKLFPKQVKLSIESTNRGISGASQLALDQASGSYVALLDHDDRLLPNALYEVVREINKVEEPEILYSDESRINENGVIELTFFKPDWSPFFNLAAHYSTHLTVLKTSLARDAGGFRLGYEGAQDHDLMMRAVELSQKAVVHIPMVLYQWRAHEASTARSRSAKPYAAVAGEKAVAEACARRGWPAKVEFDSTFERYRVSFEIKDSKALVSIILADSDDGANLEKCLYSILEKSSYENIEIIALIQNHQVERSKEMIRTIQKIYNRNFIVVETELPSDHLFSFKKAVIAAKGDHIIFMNSNLTIESPEWVQEMLRLSQLSSIGMVAPKVLSSKGQIAHAGLVGLGDSPLGAIGEGMSADSNHYFSYFQTIHEVLAVHQDCFMVEKKKLESILAHIDISRDWVSYSSLLLTNAGLSNIYVPYSVLRYFDQKQTRLSNNNLTQWQLGKDWGSLLMADPYLNANLAKSPHFRSGQSVQDLQPREKNFQKLLKPFIAEA
ncbi:MAG: glycosyltransferase [Proteobacteria bacterium]|nr:MAG: glycosyltransferase [Pseudomonadota bacterium]